GDHRLLGDRRRRLGGGRDGGLGRPALGRRLDALGLGGAAAPGDGHGHGGQREQGDERRADPHRRTRGAAPGKERVYWATRSSTAASTSKLACTAFTSSFSSSASISFISLAASDSSTGTRARGSWVRSALSSSTPACTSASRAAVRSDGSVITS